MSFRSLLNPFIRPLYHGLILPGNDGSVDTPFAANRMLGIPMWVPVAKVFSEITFGIQTASGNLDVGIGTADRTSSVFTRIISSGSFACPAAGPRAQAIAPTFLPAGQYYLVMSADNAVVLVTLLNSQVSPGNFFEENLCFTTGGSFPIPASRTPLTFGSAVTFPVLGAD